MDDVNLDQREQRLWGEAGLGVAYGWNSQWSSYGEADYARALAGADSFTAMATGGIKSVW